MRINSKGIEEARFQTKLTEEQLTTLAKLHVKLTSLGVDGEFLPDVFEGPIITLYKFVPKNATRVSLVERLAPDMAIAISAEAVQVRRLAGEPAIGIFVPNKIKRPFPFQDFVSEVWRRNNLTKIPICFGIDYMGNAVVEDLITLPHLLIAGSTGSGKSTLLNAIISSLIYCKDPSELKIILCDPKQVEFSHFTGAKHLVNSIAYSSIDILGKLEYLIQEVESRLSTLAKAGVQNIQQYNQIKFRIPYIVLVIDELADPLQDESKDEFSDNPKKKLGKKIEFALGKIAAKARATGIHIITATQRPSVKVVEGNIKANFPARLSFRLPSEVDSRIILSQCGAENLLSQGDCLYLSPNSPTVRRIHAPLAKIEDIKMAVEMRK